MGFKVVNTIHLPGVDFGENLLAPLDAELVNVFGRTEDEIISNAADADAVICSGPVQPWTARVLRSLSKCRIIASLGVGYDRIDLDVATECNIAVTNVPDYCIDEVSGMAIALILALGRKLFTIDKAVRENQINFIPPSRKNLSDIVHPVFRMRDQTVGIIGFGKIGTAVALKARGLGMRVIAYDPHVFGSVIRSHGAEPADFDTLLRESDFISINAALNEETRNMIGDEELRQMKSACYLVNTARGEIVDQPALIRALQEGVIAGAGLDVTTDDPMTEDNPLLGMSNVILTGHSGWYSVSSDSDTEFWHKAMAQAVLALKGEWPLYAVNPEAQKKWLEKWGKKPEK
ncbi:C-terminal binding protein [Desulfonema magnum]|uniref:Phosphoglycerate dehydrogenase family protein n=1 Tax=Desulfonema magnum TaxID=45655 RepID=A0A975BM53_9BACT|nr:C-terminal binding protein [Desulfonema magnum]QTA87996.1 Phosphoglycerate dehydrogenase family protein [Desulfonema magnum]